MAFQVYDYREDIRNILVTPQIRSRFLKMDVGQVNRSHSHDLGHEIFLILQVVATTRKNCHLLRISRQCSDFFKILQEVATTRKNCLLLRTSRQCRKRRKISRIFSFISTKIRKPTKPTFRYKLRRYTT